MTDSNDKSPKGAIPNGEGIAFTQEELMPDNLDFRKYHSKSEQRRLEAQTPEASAPREFWIQMGTPDIIAESIKEISECRGRHRLHLPIHHVIEYSAYLSERQRREKAEADSAHNFEAAEKWKQVGLEQQERADSFEAELIEARREIERLKADTPAMCAYCTFELPKGSKLEDLQRHIIKCEYHPLVQELKRMDASKTKIRNELTRAKEAIRGLREALTKSLGKFNAISDTHDFTKSQLGASICRATLADTAEWEEK